MTDYREYRSNRQAAKPAVALIIGAVIVAGAAAVTGVETLATPLPAHPAMVHTGAAPGLPGIPAR